MYPKVGHASWKTRARHHFRRFMQIGGLTAKLCTHSRQMQTDVQWSKHLIHSDSWFQSNTQERYDINSTEWSPGILPKTNPISVTGIAFATACRHAQCYFGRYNRTVTNSHRAKQISTHSYHALRKLCGTNLISIQCPLTDFNRE
jgi:hypothetical protein